MRRDRDPWFAALPRWWREHRWVFWIHERWEWGWLGNGWQRLALGKIAVYFPAESPPYVRTTGFLTETEDGFWFYGDLCPRCRS